MFIGVVSTSLIQNLRFLSTVIDSIWPYSERYLLSHNLYTTRSINRIVNWAFSVGPSIGSCGLILNFCLNCELKATIILFRKIQVYIDLVASVYCLNRVPESASIKLSLRPRMLSSPQGSRPHSNGSVESKSTLVPLPIPYNSNTCLNVHFLKAFRGVVTKTFTVDMSCDCSSWANLGVGHRCLVDILWRLIQRWMKG